jgi:hypothetical protein
MFQQMIIVPISKGRIVDEYQVKMMLDLLIVSLSRGCLLAMDRAVLANHFILWY